MTAQFGQTMHSELIKIGQRQEKNDSDPALRFVLGMDTIGQHLGMLAPLAAVRGSRPAVVTPAPRVSNTKIKELIAKNKLKNNKIVRSARPRITADAILRQRDFMNAVDTSTLDLTNKMVAKRKYNPAKSYAKNIIALNSFILATTKKNAFTIDAIKGLNQIKGFDYDAKGRDIGKIFDIYDPLKTNEQNMAHFEKLFAEKIKINKAIKALKLSEADLEIVKSVYNRLNRDSPNHYYEHDLHNRFLKFIAETPLNDPSFSTLGLVQYIKTVKYDSWSGFLLERGF
jgi:hypothetical protein